MESSAMQTARDALLTVLGRSQSFYLATVNAAGVPWNAGAFFTSDPDEDLFSLETVLESGGSTLANLKDNAETAVVIAGGDPFVPFAQAAATAEIHDEATTQDKIAAMISSVPQSAPLFQGPPVTAVTLAVSRWKVTDVAGGLLPGVTLTPEVVAS